MLGTLAAQHCCLSAHDIAERVRTDGRPVGLATVYRTLDLLFSLGLLQRVDVATTARYEPVRLGAAHHHAVCDSCGRVDAFEDETLEQVLRVATGRIGYESAGHEVTVHGACPDCAEVAA
ncbi:MAG: transcriptional repressor [Gaiellaceae bacterium MAG52_C11]|nr:transcriptional repressor [Candidatus Gaiellasilicea maunaloa]